MTDYASTRRQEMMKKYNLERRQRNLRRAWYHVAESFKENTSEWLLGMGVILSTALGLFVVFHR